MTKYDIAIIGGDRRTACMVPILAEKGYRIICFRTVQTAYSPSIKSRITYAKSLREALDAAPVIIGGIPFTKSGSLYCEEGAPDAAVSISEIQRSIRKNQKIFAGVIPESFRQTCEEREIGCYDFMLDEPITLYNAVSTAEGAILEALLHKGTNLHMSHTLVLGYGRCGKVIADRLKGLHACVTVCSNNESELALACALGFETLHLSSLCRKICCYEYIFNTIPARVLNRRCLENLAPGALIIDIASNKSGADYETAEKLNVNIRFCPGLPGKYAGESCAKYLADYVTSRIV